MNIRNFSLSANHSDDLKPRKRVQKKGKRNTNRPEISEFEAIQERRHRLQALSHFDDFDDDFFEFDDDEEGLDDDSFNTEVDEDDDL
ncbi:MAG: hypothetical protein ACI9UK_001329 [Candidatus Krumholzibacteriia bacterium]|jgi:hypothetical protein